ncbi:MAG: transposase [candidate division WOR-3 bacterium]
MRRKVILATGNLYHIFNRGVEKRKIFLDDKDYFRFLHDLYEFNDLNAALNINYYFSHQNYGNQVSIVRPRERKLLVDVLCFCLMPTHFHLLVRQIRDDGIKLFLQKLTGGYARYFNTKYKRVGPLFQGPFKAILIEKENYFLHLSRYIHLNPVELIQPDWKEQGIKDWTEVNKFLAAYRWSSLLDYIGINNYPSVINKGLIEAYFKTPQEYKAFVTDWKAEDFQKLTMETRFP